MVALSWTGFYLGLNGGGAWSHNCWQIKSVFGTSSDTRWGGAVGTGIEFGFAPGWPVAAEYDHLFMGRRDIAFTDTLGLGLTTRVDSIKQDVGMATVRVNYRFGGPVVARY